MESKTKTIMLVDDNEVDNIINEKILSKNGLSEVVYTHSSAKSALEFIKNIEKLGDAAFQCAPDIILLDLNMPLMDGFQFLKEYKKVSSIIKDKCKVYAFSCSKNPNDVKRAEDDENIQGFINKPLSKSSLDMIAQI